MRVILFFCLLLIARNVTAQNQNDWKFIQQQTNTNLLKLESEKSNNPLIFQTRSKNIFIAYNPFSLFLKGSMFFYQRLISPQISAECLYQTSCSNFSKLSIQRYGLIKGLLLTSDRLMRCNRIGALDISISTIDDATGKAIDLPETYSFRKK